MRNGYLMVYPKRENVALHSGYDHLKSYRFASKRFEHKFCSTCGSSVLGDGHYDILAVNVCPGNLSCVNALIIELGPHVQGC